MSNKIIGIDPGQKGAVAITSWSLMGHCMAIDVHPMPKSAEEFADIMRPHKDAHVFLEKAQSMPRNGGKAMFSYGTHFGELRGVLAALQIKHTLVSPSIWTRILHVGCTASDPKKKSLQAVRRLFPGQKLTFGEKAKKPSDGLIDALLLADYGRRQFQK